jgi:hypothetical protein
MNFTFLSPDAGACAVKLWASGRYGFSLPKKVDIVTADGDAACFLYFNRKVRLTAELSNRAIVKIAIAQFLAGKGRDGQPVEIDHDTPPYEGDLTPVRSTRAARTAAGAAGKAACRARPGSTSNENETAMRHQFTPGQLRMLIQRAENQFELSISQSLAADPAGKHIARAAHAQVHETVVSLIKLFRDQIPGAAEVATRWRACMRKARTPTPACRPWTACAPSPN